MGRRSLALTLVVAMLLPLIGSVIAAAGCLEPCADDSDDGTCTPLCATCTSCAHSKIGIVSLTESGERMTVIAGLPDLAPENTASPHTSDIFHIPLHG